MLPPIRKSTNGFPSEHKGSEAGSRHFGDKNRKQVVAPAYPDPHSNVLDQVAGRMHALERDNERFREEIQHLRQFYSSNQQQQENDQLSVGKIAEDLQRLASSFNNKLQADMGHQQHEQQKSALLFAEVSRLGHRVEGLESELKGVYDDTQRKFEAQDQHAQFLASVSSKQQQAVSPSRTSEFQRQMRDVQDSLVQLRNEVDADRSTRWKTDAAVDAKIDAQLERLNTKLTTDKRDLVRVLDEQRQLLTGADFQRVTAHMREFSQVNDHLLALERWLHSEFGQVKRIFQAFAGDVDARFQCVLAELANGLKLWHAAQVRQEDELGLRFQDLVEATQAVALTVQRKLRTLEEVIPLEVQARQKNDDKLRRRVEGVVKALGHAIETSRGEYLPQQSTLVDRLQQLELAQRNASDEVTLQHNAMRETIQAFTKDSDAMLVRLATAVEQERVKGDEIVTAREAALEVESTHTSEELRTETRQVREDVSALKTWITQHEQECCHTVQAVSPVISPMTEETHASEVLAESRRVKEELGALQDWTTMHAQECRRFFDFLNWSMEDARRESVVVQCLDAVIDQVAETQTCVHLTTLTNGVNGALKQVAAVRADMNVAAAPAFIAATPQTPKRTTRIDLTSPTRSRPQLLAHQYLQRVESSARSLETENAADLLDLSTTTDYASVNSEQMDRLSPPPVASDLERHGHTANDGKPETSDKGQHLLSSENLDRSPRFASLPKPNTAEIDDDEEEYSMDVSQDDGTEHPAISHTKPAVHQNKLHEAEDQEHPPDHAHNDTLEKEEPLTLDL